MQADVQAAVRPGPRAGVTLDAMGSPSMLDAKAVDKVLAATLFAAALDAGHQAPQGARVHLPLATLLGRA